MNGDNQEDDDESLSTWNTERLKALEEYLYDCEVRGEDVWFLRDQILKELNSRGEL